MSQSSVTVHVGRANVKSKSVGLAYLFLFLAGLFGVHHFYLGKIGRGFGYLVTFGWMGVGPVIDFFTLRSQVRRVNAIGF